jgi:hypothetical protein
VTHLLNHVPLARQRTHQPEQQMNFHLGKSMNCPIQLALSDTTCPQRLWESNPVEVVTCPLPVRPSRSSSRLCPLFPLVGFDQSVVYPSESLVSPECFSVVHGIRKDGFSITNSLAPQSTNTLAEYHQGHPNSIGKGLPVCTRIMTKFSK